MPVRSNREKLIETSNRGGITLVLGAGICRPLGIPNWEGLAKRVWEEAYPEKDSPWNAPKDESPQFVPQFLPIVFEMAFRKLGRESFIETLQKCLYRDVTLPTPEKLRRSKTSFAVIAKLIQQEHQLGGRGRLVRVITFNVDNLLEIAVLRLGRGHSRQACESFARAGRRQRWNRGDEPIAIFHLHGFIPRMNRRQSRASWLKNYDHMLVFTDSQYWGSSSKMLSFANRIMGFALQDSYCVFVGLSMTDINLLRWLALRHNELWDEWETITRNRLQTGQERQSAFGAPPSLTGIRRHYWIRPASDDPTGFLTKFLETRGVQSVEIRSWSTASFANLMTKCFPPP